MQLLPTKRSQKDRRKGVATGDDNLGRGMEFAIVVIAFLGLGALVDGWLGTKPLFIIVLVVLGLIGQFASMWYGYDARMRQHEAERAANTTAAGRTSSDRTTTRQPSTDTSPAS